MKLLLKAWEEEMKLPMETLERRVMKTLEEQLKLLMKTLERRVMKTLFLHCNL